MENKSPRGELSKLSHPTVEESILISAWDEASDMADGVLAVPGPAMTDQIRQDTHDAIDRILENQDKAEAAFGDAAAKTIVIPYDKNTKKFNPHHVQMYLAHDLEMPYSRSAVNSGVYKAWIEQVNSLTLKGWRDGVDIRLSDFFSRRFMPPEWSEICELRVHKLMYEIELVRRMTDWSIEKKQSMFESFELDLTSLKDRYMEYIQTFMYEDGHPLDDNDDPDQGLPY